MRGWKRGMTRPGSLILLRPPNPVAFSAQRSAAIIGDGSQRQPRKSTHRRSPALERSAGCQNFQENWIQTGSAAFTGMRTTAKRGRKGFRSKLMRSLDLKWDVFLLDPPPLWVGRSMQKGLAEKPVTRPDQYCGGGTIQLQRGPCAGHEDQPDQR